MVNDLALIMVVWLIGLVMQLSAGLVMVRVTKDELIDGGWGMGRIVGWLVVGLTVWFGGHMQLTVNSVVGVGVVSWLWLLLAARWIWVGRKEVLGWLGKRWRVVMVEEVLFLAGLVFMVLVRGYNPDILDLEKFMDMGFINSYLRAETLPAGDMWLAGSSINYYSFGHFLGSVMIRLWGVEIAWGYNLLLGWLMGLVMSGAFSVVVNLAYWARGKVKIKDEVEKVVLVAGVIGAMLVVFGGNSHAAWYWIRYGGFEGYWYADATRFIENTIHEFPGYSFVVSDLHAHLWNLPIVLLFVSMLAGWGKAKKRSVWSIGMGVVMGVMVMTNTWDVMVYGLLAVMFGLMMLISRRVTLGELALTGLMGLVVTMAVAAPWLIEFDSIGQGARIVEERSRLGDFMILWLGHLVLSGLVLWWSFKNRQKNWLVVAGVITAWMLLVIPELIYVKDIYPSHPRANTMFKLTYQSFVLMSIMIGVGLGLTRSTGQRIVMWSLVILGLCGFLAYTPQAYLGYYSSSGSYRGINGEKWLAKEVPGDYGGILWLRNNARGGEVVLEAVGESYTKNARVSAFTGLPTVLGWRVHEWLWRGGFDIPGERTEEVRVVYEDPGSRAAWEVLERYGVRYVFVGTKEREAYENLDENGLKELGRVVYMQEGTTIVEIGDGLRETIY